MRVRGIRYVKLDSGLIRDRLVRNPNYGGRRVSYRSWCLQPVTPATRKKLFFEALTESVKKDGFRNPILVYSLDEGVCIVFGASRLRVAQELDIQIPAIVNDVNDRFRMHPEVTPENYHEFFTDVPKHVVFKEYDGFDYHYSLERNRRDTFDKAGIAWADSDAEFIEKEFSWIDRDEL